MRSVETPPVMRGARIAALSVLSLVAVGLAAGAALAQGSAWKWRDEQGRVQYSDRPPPQNIPDKNILVRPVQTPGAAVRQAVPPPAAAGSDAAAAAAPAPGSKASGALDAALEARRKQAEAAEKAKRAAEEEKIARQRQENCQRARDYQRVLQDGGRIARTNAQGERSFMSDEERAQETNRAREIISTECAP